MTPKVLLTLALILSIFAISHAQSVRWAADGASYYRMDKGPFPPIRPRLMSQPGNWSPRAAARHWNPAISTFSRKKGS